MKFVISKIDLIKVFATCLVVRLIIGGAFASPRSFAVGAGIYAIVVLMRLIGSLIQKIAGIVAKTQWSNLARQSFPATKATQLTTL